MPDKGLEFEKGLQIRKKTTKNTRLEKATHNRRHLNPPTNR